MYIYIVTCRVARIFSFKYIIYNIEIYIILYIYILYHIIYILDKTLVKVNR